jgi:hypothetical protein
MVSHRTLKRRNDKNFFRRLITVGDDGTGLKHFYVTVHTVKFLNRPNGETILPRTSTYTFPDVKQAKDCAEHHINESLAAGYTIVS